MDPWREGGAGAEAVAANFQGVKLYVALGVYVKQFCDPKSQRTDELINTILYFTGCTTIIESYIMKTGASMLL